MPNRFQPNPDDVPLREQQPLFALELGQPEHGWIPVRIVLDSQAIAFEASDVPNNPVERLIDALHDVLEGREASVWWHLEPAGWFFQLVPETEMVRFSLLFSDDSLQDNAVVRADMRGSIASVLIPLLKGLEQFQQYAAVDPHWPPTPTTTLQDLHSRIASFR